MTVLSQTEKEYRFVVLRSLFLNNPSLKINANLIIDYSTIIAGGESPSTNSLSV